MEINGYSENERNLLLIEFRCKRCGHTQHDAFEEVWKRSNEQLTNMTPPQGWERSAHGLFICKDCANKLKRGAK